MNLLRTKTIDSALPAFLQEPSHRKRAELKQTIRVTLFACLYSAITAIAVRGDIYAVLRMVLYFGLPLSIQIWGLRQVQKAAKKWPYLVAVLVVALAFTLVFTINLILAPLAIGGYFAERFQHAIEFVKQTWWWLYPASYLWIVIILSFRAISKKIGPGVFWNWIRGYYHLPRHENRVFMFLDLKGSTTLAEEMGNEKFGALLRDFMDDLGDAVAASKGQISHYIGDEAVLTWQDPQGFKKAAPVECFYRFKQIIIDRKDHYLDAYGLVPEFKAGIHHGEVVATEVGSLKSEIVYLGDVLNTTARIQSMCNEFQTDLLISQETSEQLPSLPWLGLEPVGEVVLKGKLQPVSLVRAYLNLGIRT